MNLMVENGILLQTVYPWKKMLLSAPVCAYGFSRFAEGWTTSFMNQFITVFVTGKFDLELSSL